MSPFNLARHKHANQVLLAKEELKIKTHLSLIRLYCLAATLYQYRLYFVHAVLKDKTLWPLFM